MIGLIGCGQTTTSQTPDNKQNLDSEYDKTIASTENIIQNYTLDELSKHSVPENCWLLIQGKIYDVSGNQSHPGGEAIFEGCGKDATELFNTRPMGSGTPHSDVARNYLENYYIGDLQS